MAYTSTGNCVAKAIGHRVADTWADSGGYQHDEERESGFQRTHAPGSTIRYVSTGQLYQTSHSRRVGRPISGAYLGQYRAWRSRRVLVAAYRTQSTAHGIGDRAYRSTADRRANAEHMPRNRIQEAAIPGQLAPVMRFLVLDFGVYAMSVPASA
eukprot:2694309-Rhodomonas_salina.6